jgi:hypothetical protein
MREAVLGSAPTFVQRAERETFSRRFEKMSTDHRVQYASAVMNSCDRNQQALPRVKEVL